MSRVSISLYLTRSCSYESYLESNLQWSVNQTRNGGKLLYIKKYVHTQAISHVTSGNEALVVSGNKVLYVCVKEVWPLCAQQCFDTFHKLLITVHALWSIPVIQIGKQVAVTWSEIRAVRRVVKQLLQSIRRDEKVIVNKYTWYLLRS
jgi:hypothetical protein